MPTDPFADPAPLSEPDAAVGPQTTPLWAVGLAYTVWGLVMLWFAEAARGLRYFGSVPPPRTGVDFAADAVAVALGLGLPILAFVRYKPQTGSQRMIAGMVACELAGVLAQLAAFLPYGVGAIQSLPDFVITALLVIGPLSLIPALILELILGVRSWHARHRAVPG